MNVYPVQSEEFQDKLINKYAIKTRQNKLKEWRYSTVVVPIILWVLCRA